MNNPKSIRITGNSAVQKLSASHVGAKMIMVCTPAGNTDPCRIGGPEVSSTVGFPIPKAQPPVAIALPDSEVFGFYFLDEINVYVSTNDFLDVLYA